MALTAKQARFVDEYMIDLNATQACIRAGYSKKTADRIGPELLGKTWVAEAIATKRLRLEKKFEITQDRILQEYARLAFFDPRKLFDETGRPLSIQQLDDDTAAVIAGVEICQVGNSEMGIGEILKMKIADKKGALDSVARHLGMFNDKLNLNITDALADRLSRAKKRE